MGNDIIIVDRTTILTLINSVQQFCNITEIKGFDSINIILGIEMSLEGILKSAAAQSNPKPKEAVGKTPKEEAEDNALINFTARQAEGKV